MQCTSLNIPTPPKPNCQAGRSARKFQIRRLCCTTALFCEFQVTLGSIYRLAIIRRPPNCLPPNNPSVNPPSQVGLPWSPSSPNLGTQRHSFGCFENPRATGWGRAGDPGAIPGHHQGRGGVERDRDDPQGPRGDGVQPKGQGAPGTAARVGTEPVSLSISLLFHFFFVWK